MVAPVQTTTLVLHLPVQMLAPLETAARKKGYRTAQYAQMIFEAAFAARVSIDRNQKPLDRELDEQVRLVFAHAGQGTAAAIGRAIGIPADRVERILAGWQHAAKHSNTPERPSINDESSPEAGPQAEASLAGTGTGTLAGREGRPEGEAASASLPTNPEAKASEDNGRITGGAGPVTGEASRPDAGRSASATVEKMTVTSPGGENPAPIRASVDARPTQAKPVERQNPAPVKVNAPVLEGLTPRQSAVLLDIARRVASSEPMHADEIARATVMKPADVASAVKTLMGRALISRAAGRYTLTTRGTALAASLSSRAA